MIYQKELSEKIIGCAFEVYNNLGHGFLEKVYEKAMMLEMASNDIAAEFQKKIDVYYKNTLVGEYFADIVVENRIILELKSCSHIDKSHTAQLIHYLKATNMKVGYILNFGNDERLEFKRFVS